VRRLVDAVSTASEMRDDKSLMRMGLGLVFSFPFPEEIGLAQQGNASI
jgi:hypothetical protein